MKKVDSVWLEKSGDCVLVDVGSRAEIYWRELGYKEHGHEELVVLEELIAEKPVKKTRARKASEPKV